MVKNKRITIKIESKDVRKGNPYWEFSRFKRVHKSKKSYTRKKKHKKYEEQSKKCRPSARDF